jgi:hypothetical protein
MQDYDMAINYLTVLQFPYGHNGELKPSYNIDTSYLVEGQEVHHNIMIEVDSELGSIFKDLTELIQEHIEKVTPT